MFTTKRIILTLVLMLMSIMLAQGIHHYFHDKFVAIRAQHEHARVDGSHYPESITKTVAGINLLANGGTAANKIRLLADEAQHDHRANLIGQTQDVLGRAQCAIPCTKANFVALDGHSGFFISDSPNNSGDRMGGKSPSDKQKQSNDGEAGASPKPSPIATGSTPYGGSTPAGGGKGMPSDKVKPAANPGTDPDSGTALPGKSPQSYPTADNDPVTVDLGPFIPLNGPLLTAEPADGNSPFRSALNSTHPVPEPTVIALVVIGLLSMVWLRRKPD